jgi:hypothetical protein
MRTVDMKNQFWDGHAWQDFPASFRLRDSNNFCVGFYRNGSAFQCQYGGTWPGEFDDWDIDAAPHAQKIAAWKNNIETTWTGKFDIKRHDCKSAKKECCRYRVKASVRFTKLASFTSGTLIIARGNIRSNDSLFFIQEPRMAMAAHEFGHHIGNPDEYSGAQVDTSLNDDGAVQGIDPDSIMGQDLTKVKARHLRLVASVLADAVRAEYGKTYRYEVVPP